MAELSRSAATPAAELAAATGLAKGLDLLGALAWPRAPNPILVLANDPNAAGPFAAALAGAVVGDPDPEVFEEELRLPRDSLVLNCETPGSVGADQISPPPLADPAELLATKLPLPRGGDDVTQPAVDGGILALLAEGADQVSLAPKIDDIVLELNGGRPPAGAAAEGAFEPCAPLRPPDIPGARPKLSMLGS